MSHDERENLHQNDDRTRRHGYIFAIVCALVAGMSFTVGKLGVAHTDAITWTFWVFLFAVPMSSAAAWWQIRRRPIRIDRRGLPFFLGHVVMAVCGIWLFWASVKRLDPAVAGFLSRIQALVVISVSIVFLGERLRPVEIVGGAIAIVGVVVMKLPAGDGPLVDAVAGHQADVGFWLMIGASVCIGLSENFAKVGVKTIDPVIFVGIRNVILASVFAVLAGLNGQITHVDGDTLGLALLTAVLAPVVGRSLYMMALRRLELSRAALIQQVQPIVTAATAMIVIGTIPKVLEWVGGLLILAGCALLVCGYAHGARRNKTQRISAESLVSEAQESPPIWADPELTDPEPADLKSTL